MSLQPSPSSSATTPGDGVWRSELARLDEAYRSRDERQTDQRAWSPIRPEAHWLAFSIQRFLFSSLAACGWTTESIAGCRLLEVGCGSGRVLGWLKQAGVGLLWGCDALILQLKQASQAAAAQRLFCANMAALPFADESFDCVVQVTAFSSCLDASLRQAAAAEMLRVLKPSGCILWCDFRPMAGQAGYVRGIDAGEIARLFPRAHRAFKHFGATPLWLGRLASLANQSWRLLTPKRRPSTKLPLVAASLMERCPWLTTYVGAVIRKNNFRADGL